MKHCSSIPIILLGCTLGGAIGVGLVNLVADTIPEELPGAPTGQLIGKNTIDRPPSQNLGIDQSNRIAIPIPTLRTPASNPKENSQNTERSLSVSSVAAYLAATDPGWQRDRIATRLVESLFESNPAAAKAWAEESELEIRSAAIGKYLELLSEDNPNDALLFLRTIPVTSKTGNSISIAVKNIAAVNPKAAITFLEEARDRLEISTWGNLGTVLTAWASQDPSAALNYLREADLPVQSKYFPRIFGATYANNPEEALTMLNSVEDRRMRELMITENTDLFIKSPDAAITIASVISSEKDRQIFLSSVGIQLARWKAREAQEYVARLDPDVQRNVMPVIAGTLAYKEDIDAGIEYANSIENTDVRGEAKVNVAVSMFNKVGPEDALEFASTIETQAARNLANQFLIQRWAPQNPIAAEEWLKTQPPSEELREAIRAFADKLSQTKPETAIRWANRLPNSMQDSRDRIIRNAQRTIERRP
ncbi:MAG: hypothetical protein AAF591_03920 [Verrucomicrobiota bacterium]